MATESFEIAHTTNTQATTFWEQQRYDARLDAQQQRIEKASNNTDGNTDEAFISQLRRLH